MLSVPLLPKEVKLTKLAKTVTKTTTAKEVNLTKLLLSVPLLPEEVKLTKLLLSTHLLHVEIGENSHENNNKRG